MGTHFPSDNQIGSICNSSFFLIPIMLYLFMLSLFIGCIIFIVIWIFMVILKWVFTSPHMQSWIQVYPDVEWQRGFIWHLGHKSKRGIYWEDIELSCGHQWMSVSGFCGNPETGQKLGIKTDSFSSFHSTVKAHFLLFASFICLLYSAYSY